MPEFLGNAIINVFMLSHNDANQVKVPHSHCDGEQIPSGARGAQLRIIPHKWWYLAYFVLSDLLNTWGLCHYYDAQ